MLASKKARLGCLIISLPLLACITYFWIYPRVTDVIYQDEVEVIRERYLLASSLAESNRAASAYAYMSPEYRRTVPIEEFERSSFFYDLQAGFPLATVVVNLTGNQASIFAGYPGSFLKLELSVGVEYDLVKKDGKWFFTGESLFYLD